MATYKLTSKADHGLTGLPVAYMGWHFTGSNAMDVFESFAHLQEAGWVWNLYPNPANPWLQQMSVTKSLALGQPPTQLIINDTDWYTLDGEMVRIFSEADAAASYDIEAYTPPALPPPPDVSRVVLSTAPGTPAPEPQPALVPAPLPEPPEEPPAEQPPAKAAAASRRKK